MDLTLEDSAIDHLIKVILNHYGIPFEQMKAKSRKREVCVPRQMAMFFLKLQYESKVSLNQIGKFFGKRNHSTVIQAQKTVTALYQTDSIFREEMNRICEEIDPELKCKLEAIKR